MISFRPGLVDWNHIVRRRTIGWAATAAVLIAFATPNAARAVDLAEAFEDYILQLGVQARTVGICEPHLPAGYVDDYRAGILDKSGPNAYTVTAFNLRLLLDQTLQDGRAVAAKKKWSAADCKALLRDQVTKVTLAQSLYEAVARLTPGP